MHFAIERAVMTSVRAAIRYGLRMNINNNEKHWELRRGSRSLNSMGDRTAHQERDETSEAAYPSDDGRCYCTKPVRLSSQHHN